MPPRTVSCRPIRPPCSATIPAAARETCGNATALTRPGRRPVRRNRCPRCAYRRSIAAGMRLLCAALKQATQCCETALPLPGITFRQRGAQRRNGDSRDQARQENAAESDSDRECARERLPRPDIAITDGETGDEGEIDRFPDRPTLEEPNQEAKAELDHQNRRQDRPGDKEGAAECDQEASPQDFCRRPLHAPLKYPA